MKKYEYQIYWRQDKRWHPQLRYRVLYFWWSKWWYMESISGTAIGIYPDKERGCETEEEALEVIKEHEEMVKRRGKELKTANLIKEK